MTMLTSISESGLSGNTKISLLDGSNQTLEEITEHYDQDNPNYIYTLSKNGIIFSPIIDPRLIGKDVATLIVVLNSGEEVCCTPNYVFMMRDGTYKEAKDLQLNDSLMPLYKNYSRKNGGGYERVYDHINNCKRYTHRLVLKQKLRIKSIPSGYEVHHKKDRTNNDPRELELLLSNDHKKLHKKDYKELNKKIDIVQKAHKQLLEHNKNKKGHIGIDLLCKVASESHKVSEVCRKLNLTTLEIKQIIEKFSISYSNFLLLLCRQKSRTKKNHKVVEIKPGPVSDIYNVSVLTTNFALSAGVFVSPQ
jgi:hypothetical protein